MKFDTKRNLTTDCGRPLILVEIGTWLFFGPEPDHKFEVIEIRDSRPFSGELDLFQYWKDTGIHPIVLSI